MTKTKFWLSLLAISVVLIAGSLAVSPIAFAGDDEDDDDLSSLQCPNGQTMTGIQFEDDDEIVDVICDNGDGNAITTIHTPSTNGFRLYALGETINTQTFTLDNPATVYITAHELALFTSTDNILALKVDGTSKANGYADPAGGQFRTWDTVTLSWTGQLSAGSHTITTESVKAATWEASGNWGAINTLIIE